MCRLGERVQELIVHKEGDGHQAETLVDLRTPDDTLFHKLLYLTVTVVLFDVEVDKLLLCEDIHYRFDFLEPGLHLRRRCALRGLRTVSDGRLLVALKEAQIEVVVEIAVGCDDVAIW